MQIGFNHASKNKSNLTSASVPISDEKGTYHMCNNRHKYHGSVFCAVVATAMVLGAVSFIAGCPSSVPAPSEVVVGAQAILPELVITSPGQMAKLRKGEILSITWKVVGQQDLGGAKIALVLDRTQQITGNSILIAEGVDPSLGHYELDTSTFGSGAGEETGIAYYVIGTLHAGNIPYSSDSSEGYVIVTVVDIAVLKPDTNQNSGLDSVLVAWDVTGGKSTDFVDISADQDGNPFNGNEKLLIADIPVEAGSIAVDFTLLEAGQYEVVCKLIRVEAGDRQILDASSAAGKIVIGNVYSGEYDLRTLSSYDTRGFGPIDGVVFEGYNIDD
ncbi:hypothetical protein LCGC14_2924250, partial [marine sediment metagenome]